MNQSTLYFSSLSQPTLFALEGLVWPLNDLSTLGRSKEDGIAATLRRGQHRTTDSPMNFMAGLARTYGTRRYKARDARGWSKSQESARTLIWALVDGPHKAAKATHCGTV